MTRHTIETVRNTISALIDKEIVYKVEVDDLKYAFNYAFEKDWVTVKDTKHLSVDRAKRPKTDNDLYYAAPYEVRHWYGNKFSTFLDGVPPSEFKDAAMSHRNRWRPLYIALKDLIARQTKGRRPAEPKKVVDTRIQLRAICPCCFREQAVNVNLMVSHGYTLDYGFQNGICSGYRKHHFGTAEGLSHTKALVVAAANRVIMYNARLQRAQDGEIKPRHPGTLQIIENPTKWELEDFINGIKQEIKSAEFYAGFLREKVETWTPAAPREVTIEVTE
jgi:hypothetical protein